jgi:hypothetical protein
MMDSKSFRLRTHEGEDGAAYLELRDHPHVLGAVDIAQSIYIHSLIPNYHGPRMVLDLDKEGRPVGIEIVYFDEENEEE